MKKRVAFLSRYVGQVNRGVETHVKELTTRLSKSFDIQILTGRDSDSITKIVSSHFDLVIPTNGRTQALKASIGRFFGGYKTLVVGHAGVGIDDIWNLLMLPNVFVALTDKEFEWAKKWTLKSKLKKIPNGVDLQKFSSEGVKATLDLERPIILSVGALEWYKNHDKTIKAVSRLERGSLLIIGNGKEKTNLDKLGQAFLGEKRFKIMEVSYQDIPRFYRSADIFTLPSWDREAFGIVYLEAMACNLPVVAPCDQSRKEIVGNGGVLVDTDNLSQFASALQEALNKKWQDLPRRQASSYSWDKIAEEYKKLFDNLVS